MISAEAFLDKVNQIASERPKYRTGGNGRDGTCDCIGLVMGAIARAGGKSAYPLHSSNYFARCEMDTLETVDDASVKAGMVVYKARKDTGDLNARYKPRGTYYTGDLLDYYHVGVVRSASPVQIVHCTKTQDVDGICIDTRLNGWTHMGWVSGIDENAQEESVAQYAYVQTGNPDPLKLRPTPDKKRAYIAKIPNGSMVKVLANAQGWAKVEWNGLTGYCAAEYLSFANKDSEESATEPGNLVAVAAEAVPLLESLITCLKGLLSGAAGGGGDE